MPWTTARGHCGSVVTVVIADDHAAVREAVALALRQSGLDVVGTAGDGNAALALIAELRPDVAVVDVLMPRMSGTEVAGRASRIAPETAILLYTGSGERELLREGVSAGARGFLLKEAPIDELVRAVRLLAAGEEYVDQRLAAALVRASAEGELPALSARERDILSLLSEGRSNEEIGAALSISAETVRTYVGRAMQKLEADTRTQAVARAIRLKLIP